MSDEPIADRRLLLRLDPDAPSPVRVLHPCRCDAPDPEAARMEPLEAPLAELLAAGRALVVCPECDYHLLIIVEGGPSSTANHNQLP